MAETRQDKQQPERRTGAEDRHAPDPAAPARPGGVASGLQGGGVRPGAGPATGTGAIGTGGGATAAKPTGTVKRTEKET